MNTMFSRWYKKPTYKSLLENLNHWFSVDIGARVLASQQRLIDDLLVDCFGYHLLQLSVSSSVVLHRECRVQQKIVGHPFATDVDTRCQFDMLPFANESVDVVILHHVQEYVDNPHQLLREIQRIVVPHGHVIIVGFNPWSPMGVYSRFGHWVSQSIWHNKLISLKRMHDWLALLGFGTATKKFGYHMPQFINRYENPWLKRLFTQWPLGNFYIISAIKEEITMTPIKPIWTQASRRLVGLSAVKPNAASKVNRQNIKFARTPLTIVKNEESS